LFGQASQPPGGADGRGLIVAADDETHQRLVDIIRPHLADVHSLNH